MYHEFSNIQILGVYNGTSSLPFHFSCLYKIIKFMNSFVLKHPNSDLHVIFMVKLCSSFTRMMVDIVFHTIFIFKLHRCV